MISRELLAGTLNYWPPEAAVQARFRTQKWSKNHPKNDTKIRFRKTMALEPKIKEKASKNGVQKELRTATFSDFVVLVIFAGCP